MSGQAPIPTLRPGGLLASPLVVALLVSLILHLGVWGGYRAGERLGWWKRLEASTHKSELAKKNQPQLKNMVNEPPMIFVDVSRPAPEPPKQTKYYSSKNSQAANPEPDKNSTQPKINGQQKNVPKTEDVPMLPKLQPTAPPQEALPESKPAEPQPKPDPMSLGDLKLKMPEPRLAELKQTPAQVAQQRPRTLKQAQAQQNQQLPGQAMKQDGGVRRQLQWSSLDVKATAFGDYDRAIIEAVTQRWYDLLDSHRFAQDRTGKVIVHFRLLPDGTITEVKFLENTVGQLLGYVCQEAVQEAAPFAKWPGDMRRMLNANYREIAFTFYYY